MNDSDERPLSVPAAIEQRRSVRHFEADPISDELLQQLIELAVMAPTSWNLQPVRMVVVRDAEQRARTIVIDPQHDVPRDARDWHVELFERVHCDL